MTTSVLPQISVALITGLLSSLHCIGMCGPLASVGCRAGVARSFVLGPLGFVLGKFLSYSLLGLLAGFIGATFLTASGLARATAMISIGGGALMLIVIVLSRLKIGTGRASRISLAIARLSFKAGRSAPFYLGMAAALLPCGLLYAMVARSAAAGDPLLSMALMQAFGLGTSPALLGLGTLLRFIPSRWSRYGALAGEIVLAITAIVLLWRGYVGLTAPDGSCCH